MVESAPFIRERFVGSNPTTATFLLVLLNNIGDFTLL